MFKPAFRPLLLPAHLQCIMRVSPEIFYLKLLPPPRGNDRRPPVFFLFWRLGLKVDCLRRFRRYLQYGQELRIESQIRPKWAPKWVQEVLLGRFWRPSWGRNRSKREPKNKTKCPNMCFLANIMFLTVDVDTIRIEDIWEPYALRALMQSLTRDTISIGSSRLDMLRAMGLGWTRGPAERWIRGRVLGNLMFITFSTGLNGVFKRVFKNLMVFKW